MFDIHRVHGTAIAVHTDQEITSLCVCQKLICHRLSPFFFSLLYFFLLAASTATFAAAIVYLVCLIVHPSNAFVYVGFFTVAYIGLGFFNTVIWAMITDVIDDAANGL